MKTIVQTSFGVQDAATWKASYERPESVAMRARIGMRPVGVYQAADDANHITLLTEVDDLAAMRTALNSPEFQAETARSGAIAPMQVLVLHPMA